MESNNEPFRHLSSMVFLIVLALEPAATPWANAAESGTQPPAPAIPTLQSNYGKLPLSFEANQGQWDPAVQFVTRGGGHTLFLTPSEAVLSLRTGGTKNQERGIDAKPHKTLSSTSPSSYSAVRMRFEGADSQAEMVGLEPLPGIVNYFIGDDPSKWRTNIPTYQKVEYKNLYAGIDLVYYGNQGQLEYDLIVAPGADPTQIMLVFNGAEQIVVDEQGDLVLTVARSSMEPAAGAATLRMHKPLAYQRDEQGEKHLLSGTYAVQSSKQTSDHTASVALYPSETQHVAFQIASYDTSKPLIIDPVLSWATYLGGGGQDSGRGIALDQAGNAYMIGTTESSNFPGTANSPIQSTFGGYRDAIVTKLNATGTALVYSTYLGSNGNDLGLGIALDSAGNAYVTGEAGSSGFPGTASSLIQSTFGGGENDAFVIKLNAAGNALIYSTYLGGSSIETGIGIAVDAAGNAYVTGRTDTPGSGFPGTASSLIQSTFGGMEDAFVTKLNTTGTAIVYSTYLGDSGGDIGAAIAVDLAGQAYVTGSTNLPGSGFPGTANSLIQSTYGGNGDAFVTKLNAAGTSLIYSTYLGSSGGFEFGNGIAVDQEGQAYVIGTTDKMPGSSFPGTAGSPIQSTHGGGEDAFVIKLNATGTAIVYSTYLGGSDGEFGTAIAVDHAGQAYVTGSTNTPGSGFPGTAGSLIQSTNGGGQDVFVTKLNATGTALVYSTYLGGSGNEGGAAIAVDQAGNAYVTGLTETLSGFPGTAGSLIQNAFAGGNGDAFVAKITNANIVNDLVTLVPVPSTYRTTADPTGCPSGFVGTFSFDAWLTNKTNSPPLSDLAMQVKTLTNGNLLQNADGGNGGVGSTLTVLKQHGYADGTLSRNEFVDVHFNICLKARTPFSFFVDVLGTQ